MRQKSTSTKAPAEKVVRDIHRKTREQLDGYLSALDHGLTEDDETFVDSLVKPGQTSPAGVIDPRFPGTGRFDRAAQWPLWVSEGSAEVVGMPRTGGSPSQCLPPLCKQTEQNEMRRYGTVRQGLDCLWPETRSRPPWCI